MIYTSPLAAVVSALAADGIDNTAKQAWQKLYAAGSAEPGSLALLIRSSRAELPRGFVDALLQARLRHKLKPRLWNALVARYSTDRAKKVQAIGALVPVIASHAPRLFVYKAVTAWAIPPLKGVQGKRSTDMIILPPEFYDVNTWDSQGLHRSTYWRWRRGIEEVLNEMVKYALKDVEEILRHEGLLMDLAA